MARREAVPDPSDEEIKEILDDPNVPESTKRQIAAAWAYDFATGSVDESGEPVHNKHAVPDEVMAYVDKYGARDDFDNMFQYGNDRSKASLGFYNPMPVDLRELCDSAKKESEANAEHGEDTEQLSALNERLRSTGTTGEATSAAIFDGGDSGLEFFEIFTPYYNDWTGSSLSIEEFVKKYDEQREVSFAALYADRARFVEGAGRLQQNLEALRNAVRSLLGSWDGDAADSASELFDTVVVAGGETAVERLALAGDALDVVVPRIEELCCVKAQAVLDLYAVEIGGLDGELVGIVIRCARREASTDDHARIASAFGIDYESGACYTTGNEVEERLAQEATNWLNANLVPMYDSHKQAFDGVCQQTHEGFEQAWQGLRAALAGQEGAVDALQSGAGGTGGQGGAGGTDD
ncbi:WXG100 family type VII secretion target [Amycolatopsis anabasis]|uniref:WXG100 family type VII secretion target n=1 Tax=Amycolatopsis anabasis TaxID=1840409 RepID=UPI00131E7EB0|nr:hypothetical protein [Amycolatopsis anabasis]